MPKKRNAQKRITFITSIGLIALISFNRSFSSPNANQATPCIAPTAIDISDTNLTQDEIAAKLGWTKTPNRCGGYYIEAPFYYPQRLVHDKLMQITSEGPVMFSQHGTSVLQGRVTMTQEGEEVIANKALLYRDPTTNKLAAIDLFGNVNLREPGSLILAEKAHLDLVNKTQALDNITYRTAIYSNKHAKPTWNNEQLQSTRTVTHLSAWGQAKEFLKSAPKIFEFHKATYSTCPPDNTVWQVKADDIKLNKITGRGTARQARIYIRKVPILYSPYLNFPIDNRRQTGFLWPPFGSSGRLGPYASAPFYWNLAPNYDTTITPLFSGKRGWQFTDLFRYLTETTKGHTNFTILPNDKDFQHFQTTTEGTQAYRDSPNPVVQANLRRLENDSPMRGAFSWQNHTKFNPHWSSTVDYNIVSDDYFLRDLRTNLSEVTENQLLQQGDLVYKGNNWNFLTRVQQYQTLHPIESVAPFENQYSRLPQLVLDGDYPDQAFGLDYFILNDLTHFDIRKTPGESIFKPIGNRLYVQPGVSLPLNWPYLFITPRVQLSLTKYDLNQVNETNTNSSINRSIPIFDIGTGLYFDRNMRFFHHDLKQTFEPQLYYTYVPYFNQDGIPNFDTTLNTLTYDQLFSYNRFSGMDRIGDANQVAFGVTSRFLDADTADEKIRISVGEIIYFEDRRVTLCTTELNCPDAQTLENNKLRRSPVSGLLSYTLNPGWTLTGNVIWNTQINQMDNQSITLGYSPDVKHSITLGYNFVRRGDIVEPLAPSASSINNLKQANITFSWPVSRDWSAVGHITKSINRDYFQSIIFGLQYDSCCWAIRAMAGRNFINLNPLDGFRPQYNSEFYFQFALRGLGNFGKGDPNQFVSANIGSVSDFGQDY